MEGEGGFSILALHSIEDRYKQLESSSKHSIRLGSKGGRKGFTFHKLSLESDLTSFLMTLNDP